jgi:hypothetical protein
MLEGIKLQGLPLALPSPLLSRELCSGNQCAEQRQHTVHQKTVCQKVQHIYCIIPNTPRGGVTGNEMGDMVVSN